jgi:uncharacterized repeat protein (TIGR01451 family)
MFGIPASTQKSSTDRIRKRHRRRRTGLLAGLVGAIAVLTMAIGAPGASAQPWACSAYGYLFQTYPETTVAQIVQVDLATGEQTPIASTPEPVNGVGFNEVDGYYYGMMKDTVTAEWQLVRVHSDGTVDELGVPTGPGGTVDPTANFPIGEVDPSGHYWVSDTVTWYEIDLTTPTPTVLRSGPVNVPAGLSSTGNDWSWINGALYSVGQTVGATETFLVRFDPATGTYSNLGPISIAGGGTGATFADASGYLYASQNATNNIYRVDPKTRETIIASEPLPGQPQSSPGNDGARCNSAPIPTVTVTKTVEGRVRPADQFTVGLFKPDNSEATSVSTTGSATTVSTTNFPASQGKTYSITDAMAPGSQSQFSEYVQSLKCTDSAGNTAPTGGTAGKWTLNIAEATAYTCNVTNKAQADISMTKQATPSPQVPGADETYSLTIKNSGPSTAINAKVTDPLPKGLTYVSADKGCTFASGTVTCLAGDLAAGASKTFTITASVASSATSCDASAVANQATGSSDTPDPNQSNNSASACPPVAPQSDLEITKVASAPKVPAGGQVMYTLVVHNKGPSDAHGVTVDDSLPAELSLVSARPSQGSCSGTSCGLGTIVAGGNAQILVTANVASSAAGKQVTNCASVSGKQAKSSGSDRACAVTEIPPSPQPPQPVSDLKVTKKASKSKVLLGRVLTYRLKVTNLGPDDAPEAKVTDTASKRLKTISVKPSQGTCEVGTSLTCDLGTLATGKTALIKVRAKVMRAGSVKNTVSTTTGGKDPEPNNNVDGVRTKVRSKLLLRKTASARSVQAGDRLTYHLRVANPMGVAAHNVRVCDSFPAGLAYVGSSPKASASKGRVCWKLKSLRAGGSKRITVLARALPGAGGNLTNHATATARGIKAKAAAKAQSTVHVAPAPPRPTPVTG